MIRAYLNDPYEYMSQEPCDYCPYQNTDKCDDYKRGGGRMKLIIDIDEELYEAYKGKPPMLGDAGMDMIAQAIANGTPIKNGIPYEERPIGNWKDHRWCSNCGCGIPTDVYGGGITEKEAHFCVECGARMEEENEIQSN